MRTSVANDLLAGRRAAEGFGEFGGLGLAVPVCEVEFDEGEPLVVGALVAGHFDDEDAVVADHADDAEGVRAQLVPGCGEDSGVPAVGEFRDPLAVGCHSEFNDVVDDGKVFISDFLAFLLVEAQFNVFEGISILVNDSDDDVFRRVEEIFAVETATMTGV